MIRLLVVLMIVLGALASCRGASSVKPGDGRVGMFPGRSYEEIWSAALTVAREHFEIQRQDKAGGVILAERTVHFMGEGGDWVGLYITPARGGAPVYSVEVVKRKKLVTQISGQDWERKVLRDMEDVLDGRPMR